MVIMSVDFGDSRTGIAVCGKSELIASPVTVIQEKDFDKCIEKTAALAKEQRAEQVVVGYPKNMNGTIGPRAEKAQILSEEIKKLIDIPVILWDERLTTVSAHNLMNETNVRGQKRKDSVDSISAAYILQGYLDSIK